MPRGVYERKKPETSLEGGDVEAKENNDLVKPSPGGSIEVNSVAEMNDLANRIWEGQSVSLPLIERVGRIRAVLKKRGYSQSDIDSLKLPNDGYSKGYERFL